MAIFSPSRCFHCGCSRAGTGLSVTPALPFDSSLNERRVSRIWDNLPVQLSFADRSLDGCGRGGRVFDLDHPPLVLSQ
jgi:hypothetical protein